MDVASVLARVEETVSPVLEQLGYQLVERELVPQAGGWVLRLYIDKEGGVTIDDCARASRGIALEVSSPGVDRPLRRRQDFERYRGSTIRLKTSHPVNGRSNYKGTLEGLEGDDIVMTVDGVRYRLPISELAKARVEAKV